MRRTVAVAVLVLSTACRQQPPDGSLTGLITAVSDSSVTVRPLTGGQTQTFVNRAEVSLVHLHTHRNQRWPVVVEWQHRAGQRVAVAIRDAGDEPAASP